MKVISGATICDGSGGPLRQGDVVIDGEKIAAIATPGQCVTADAEVINGAGLMLAPGFIDAHAHSEARMLQHPANRTKLLQGVTTEVNGNCGSSPSCVPHASGTYCWQSLADYAALLNSLQPGVNSVVLCGHNSVREAVMGNDQRTPTAAEMASMKALLAAALADGAAGFSTGLTYFPGKFSSLAELIELTSLLKGTGKVYATHMRSEGDEIEAALAEALAIASAASCRLQVSHFKTISERNWHKLPALLARIEAARASGLEVFADRYPYVYSCTDLRQALPPPYDRIPGIQQFLRESAEHQSEVVAALSRSARDVAGTILMEAALRGRTIGAVAAERGQSAEQLCMELIMAVPGQRAAFLGMSEANMREILRQPWVCAGSDNVSLHLDDPNDFGHPRAAGTFPVFFHMVAEALGPAEAVRKMTSLPASVFNIPRRGLIKPGFYADLVLFSPERYASHADYAGNNQAPEGVQMVMVAGKMAWDARQPAEVGRHGRFIPIPAQ
ncbi:MAG: amidohydrolase family protein [Lentisphaeria bacterium]|nr:amidohydrolase family protein [Lentisphaeria bacterium]